MLLDSKQTRGGHIWTKTSSESEVGPQRGRGRREGLLGRSCSTSRLHVPVPRPPPPPVQSVGPRIMPVPLRPAPPGPGLSQMSEMRTSCLREAVPTPTPKPGPRPPALAARPARPAGRIQGLLGPRPRSAEGPFAPGGRSGAPVHTLFYQPFPVGVTRFPKPQWLGPGPQAPAGTGGQKLGRARDPERSGDISREFSDSIALGQMNAGRTAGLGAIGTGVGASGRPRALGGLT